MISIRPVTDADIPSLIALWHRAGIARPWNDPATDIAFARRGPHSTLLVALSGDALVGSAMIGEDGHRGWLYYVAVDPDRQGQGIGRQIMQAAEDWLAARGVWKVQLLVRAGNTAAEAFYDALGYADTKSRCLQKVIGRTGADD